MSETTPQSWLKKFLRPSLAKVCLIIVLLSAVITLLTCAYNYWRLHVSNTKLYANNASLRVSVADNVTQLNDLHSTVADMQTEFTTLQAFVAKQQQIISTMQAVTTKDVGQWQLRNVLYLVKLANINLQFMHNVTLAINLLNEAKTTLTKITISNTGNLLTQINADITTLNSLPVVAISELYQQLLNIDVNIDKLIFTDHIFNENQVNTPDINTDNLTFWQRGLKNTWDALKNIIIVRYNKDNILPAILPEKIPLLS